MEGFPCFQDACSSGWPNYLLSRETTSDGVRPTVLLVIVSGGLGGRYKVLYCTPSTLTILELSDLIKKCQPCNIPS